MALRPLYTIGYGGREDPFGDFLRVLRINRIEILADIRAEPIRLRPFRTGGWPEFTYTPPRPGIKEFLSSHGIIYLWLEELGNPYRKEANYIAKFSALMAERGEAITERLRSLAKRVCIMCACKSYTSCHRKVVADYLHKIYEYDVIHL